MDKLFDLLKGIRDATVRGLLSWKAESDKTFSAELEHALVECTVDHDSLRDSNFVACRFIDDQGRIVASKVSFDGDNDFEWMQEIVEVARRSALGFDVLANELKKELETLLNRPV